MLLKIYELITKLQSEIGDEAEIRLSARDGVLEIRVDWWQKDFHARHQFTEIELAKVVDETMPLNYFVVWCKNEYARKVKAG
jgi:hypothetical protein